jgi:oligosaccharide repeat unit polymerase
MLYLVLFLSVILSWIKSERLINPVSVFSIWWCGFIFLSTFKLIGMRLPSDYTYTLMISSVAMFAVGGITFLKPSSQSKKVNVKQDHHIILHKKLKMFFAFQFVCTLILLYYLSKSASMLKSMDPGVYRNMLFTEFSIFGHFKIAMTYIVEPSLYVSAIISSAGIFLYKFPKYILALSLFNLVLYSGVTLGRAPVFIAVMCLTIAFVFSLSEKKFAFKFRYLILALIPLLFIGWISLFRKNTWDIKAFLVLRDYFIWYLTGPFTAYELFIDNFKYSNDWDYSYIRGVFAGLEEIVKPVIKRIDPSYGFINDSFHEITKVFRSLGGKAIGHNSHYTMVYEFTRDAGLYGVFLFSYILGSANAFLYNRYRSDMSIKSFSLFIILLYLSLMGITRWELRYTWSWLTIFGIILISEKFVLRKEGSCQCH